MTYQAGVLSLVVAEEDRAVAHAIGLILRVFRVSIGRHDTGDRDLLLLDIIDGVDLVHIPVIVEEQWTVFRTTDTGDTTVQVAGVDDTVGRNVEEGYVVLSNDEQILLFDLADAHRMHYFLQWDDRLLLFSLDEKVACATDGIDVTCSRVDIDIAEVIVLIVEKHGGL